MSAAGEAKAREEVRTNPRLRAWVLEHGRWPVEVLVARGETANTMEQFMAERVRFACGYRDPVGHHAHGGCGLRWEAVKLSIDPDPPGDPRGDHDNCARFHRLGCAECAEKEWNRP